MDSSNEGIRTRQEIVDIIKEVRCRPNQNLRDVELPEEAYRKAEQFIRSGVGHTHYYAVLDSMKGGGVYGMLEEAADEASFDEAFELVGKWRDAFRSLFRYALNLLLAPNRPELKMVKLYNSYYVYQISDKLKGAERVLHALGYEPKPPSALESITSTSQELEFKGQVDRDHVADIAADLVIVQSDLEHLREKIRACGPESSRDRYLQDILKAWKNDYTELLIRSASFNEENSRGCFDMRVVNEQFNSAAGERTFDSNYDDRFAAGISKNTDRRTEVNGAVRPNQEGVRSPPHNDYHKFGMPSRSSAGQYRYETNSPAFHHPRPSSVASRDSSYNRNEEVWSNSTDDDSFSMAAADIPRPNIDDLPDPVGFSDDGGYSGVADVHMSLGHIINSRSDGFDDSMIGSEFYAPMPLGQSAIWSEEGRQVTVEVEPESGQCILQPVGEVGGGAGHQRLAKDNRHKADQMRVDKLLDGYVIIDKPVEEGSSGAEANKGTHIAENEEMDLNHEDAPGTLKSEELVMPHPDGTESDAPRSLLYELETDGQDGFTVLDMRTDDDDSKSNPKSPINRKSPIKHVEKLSPVKPSVAEESLKQTSRLLSDKWTCDFCTFINPNSAMTCDICGVNRK